MGLRDLIGQRKRVLQHLMTSLENWRKSTRISAVDDTHLTEEEKELKHAYDLLQRLLADVQSSKPGENVDITA